jgi:hypothetical protein
MSLLFLPGTVKSCSWNVVKEVPLREFNLLLLVAIEALRLLASDLFQPLREAMSCEAFRPSLIASAVCCLEFPDLRGGNGTSDGRSSNLTWMSAGSCSLAKVLEIFGSVEGAYFSART